MTPEQKAFYQRVILPLEEKLLALPLGTLFTGVLYDEDEVPVTLLDLRDMGDAGIVLGPAEIGRLFMAPDESVVSVLMLREQDDGTPAGVNVLSTNDFVQEVCRRTRVWGDRVGRGRFGWLSSLAEVWF